MRLGAAKGKNPEKDWKVESERTREKQGRKIRKKETGKGEISKTQ